LYSGEILLVGDEEFFAVSLSEMTAVSSGPHEKARATT
jgi:hypothetical protein